MSLKTLANKATSKVGHQVLTAQKHSPVLLLGAGVVGMVTTVVLASRATLKMDGLLKDAENHREKIEEARVVAEETGADYSEEDQKKDSLLLRTQLAIKIVRLYAPAVIIGGASIACLTGSHIVLSRRNVGLTAAYAAVDNAFKQYRGRVVEELGEQKDLEFRYGTVEKEIYEETDEGPVVKTVKALDLENNGRSMYAQVFAAHTSSRWQDSPGHNQVFIRCQQNYANDRLQRDGWLTLNAVYRSLGLPETKEGMVVGWLSNGEGDNQVDFGIFNQPGGEHFVNGDRNSVWLDFNVDGTIFGKF